MRTINLADTKGNTVIVKKNYIESITLLPVGKDGSTPMTVNTLSGQQYFYSCPAGEDVMTLAGRVLSV